MAHAITQPKQTPETHLMIVQPKYAAQILTGQKLVEVRLSSKKTAPFGRVAPGDIVFIKPTSKGVVARAVVHRVDEYENLEPEDIEHLYGLYKPRAHAERDDNAGREYWDAKADARYGTFITLDQVRLVRDESLVPQELLRPSRSAWRVLSSLRHQAKAA